MEYCHMHQNQLKIPIILKVLRFLFPKDVLIVILEDFF